MLVLFLRTQTYVNQSTLGITEEVELNIERLLNFKQKAHVSFVYKRTVPPVHVDCIQVFSFIYFFWPKLN